MTTGRNTGGGGSGGGGASSASGNSGESSQALLAGTVCLAGQKVNYLDSGYSEEDPNDNHGNNTQQVLVKTSSGSIYIPPSESSYANFLGLTKWQQITFLNKI